MGDENIPVQEAEGGGDAMGGTKQMAEGGSSSSIGCIVKKKCKRSRRPNGRQQQEMAMIGRRLAADEASGSQAERRERKGSDFCVGNDCGKGPLARVDHLGERDAAPTGLELLGRGAYVPRFLSPNPPLYA